MEFISNDPSSILGLFIEFIFRFTVFFRKMKRLIRTVNGLYLNTDLNDAFTNMLQIEKGTDSYQRIGNMTYIYKIRFNYNIYLQKGLLDNVNVRVIVYEVKQNPPGEFTAEYFFETPNGDSGFNCLIVPRLNQLNNITILYDNWTTIQSNHGFDVDFEGNTYTLSRGGLAHEQAVINLNRNVHYTQGTLPNINNVHMIVVCDQDPVDLGVVFTQRIIFNAAFELYFSDFLDPKKRRLLNSKIY